MILLLRTDIVRLEVDAIVNAANEAFRGGGGVDGAIHRAAGPGLLEECRRHARLPTGEAIVTAGHRLPARWIIHTVGPIWRGGGHGEPALLARAYDSVFAAAALLELRTLAFPAISTGVYGYPKPDAAAIAVAAMRRHEAELDEIVVALFDDENLLAYERALASST